MVTITIFVRHSADCKHAGNEFYKSCQCRKHFRWSVKGRQHRKAAETRNWAQAEAEKHELESQLSGKPTAGKPQSIVDAMTVFKADKANQGFTADIQGRYARELARLLAYCEAERVFTVQHITRELLVGYAATWPKLYPSTNTRCSVQARLRNFLRFCFESRWLDRVPKTSSIKVTESPTLPLTIKRTPTSWPQSPKRSKATATTKASPPASAPSSSCCGGVA